MNFSKNKNQLALPGAFTLVELLIAMTITLLMMAGLAKSFAVIGESIKSGRSKVTLSSKMRGVSFRLRGDLRSRTVDVKPPMKTESGLGYFMYYEGPLTEHTWGLYGAEPTRTRASGDVLRETDPVDTDPPNGIPDYVELSNSPTYRKYSRFGDFDDYIAFTAKASGNDWFTGKVPAYLVDDDATDPMEPRVIRSKYAEIIIWAAPKWQIGPTSPNTLELALHPSAMPVYRDEDNDLAPDDIVLHQRILLIRPDLNVRKPIPSTNAALVFNTDVLRPQLDSATTLAAHVPPELERLYPIGILNPASSSVPVPPPLYPYYADPNSNTNNQRMFTSNWLVGMEPLHHFFDLSLRRIVHPATGDPTGYVAANSLQDLVQPHNRFAHVRYPGRYMDRGSFASTASTSDNATSMPLLALGWNDAILNWQGANDPRDTRSPPNATPPAWFPWQSSPASNPPSQRTGNGAGAPSGLFNGWLLPQFELGDANPVGSSDGEHWERGYLTAADARWDRTGEDILAPNILAFDIKGFDPTAPSFITSGPDGQPGQIGVNDDGLGSPANDETAVIAGQEASSELGTVGSDDVVLQVSDLGIFALMGEPILDPGNTATFNTPGVRASHAKQAFSSRGAFVDLLYPYLAGSPLLRRTVQTGVVSTPPPSVAIPQVARVNTNYNAFMQSDLSLYPIPIPSASATTGMNSLKRSGKLLHADTAGNIWYFQPTYDTWTDQYEFDGFDQTHRLNGDVSGGNQAGTTWVLNNVTALRKTPRLTASTLAALQIDTGRLLPNEPETSPPVSTHLPAISITVRIAEASSEGITEFTIVEALQ